MKPALSVNADPAPPAPLSPLVASQAQRELQQRDWLLRVAQAISRPLDLREVLERVIRAAVSMTGGQAGAIALRQPGGELGLVASVRLDARFEAYLDHLVDAALNPILLMSSCDGGLAGVGRLGQQCFGGFQLYLAILSQHQAILIG